MIKKEQRDADAENEADHDEGVGEALELGYLLQHLLGRVELRTHCQLDLLQLEHHAHRENVDYHVQDAVDEHVARYEILLLLQFILFAYVLVYLEDVGLENQ